MRSGQVRSGQVSSSQVRSGQVRSDQVRSDQISSGQVRPGHPFSLVSGARSAEKILFLQPWRAQRGENFAFASLVLLQKNTKVKRYFDTKHNGRATKNLQKVFFGIFFRSPKLLFFFM